MRENEEEEAVLELLILGIIKIFDNIVLTLKSILQAKENKLLSSIFTTISQIAFYFIIKQVVDDGSTAAILVVAATSGIGNWLGIELLNKFKRDSRWTFYLTSSDKEDVMNLCNFLVQNGIKYMASNGLTRKGKETLNVIAFSKSKSESRLIENYVSNAKSKYLKIIDK